MENQFPNNHNNCTVARRKNPNKQPVEESRSSWWSLSGIKFLNNFISIKKCLLYLQTDHLKSELFFDAWTSNMLKHMPNAEIFFVK